MHSTHPFGIKEGLTGLDPDYETVGLPQGAPFSRRGGIADMAPLIFEIRACPLGKLFSFSRRAP